MIANETAIQWRQKEKDVKLFWTVFNDKQNQYRILSNKNNYAWKKMSTIQKRNQMVIFEHGKCAKHSIARSMDHCWGDRAKSSPILRCTNANTFAYQITLSNHL